MRTAFSSSRRLLVSFMSRGTPRSHAAISPHATAARGLSGGAVREGPSNPPDDAHRVGFYADLRRYTDAFAREEGRRPRILLLRPHAASPDVTHLAAILADVGCHVDLGPSAASAGDAVRQAVEADVHILLAALPPPAKAASVVDLVHALRAADATDIHVVVTGVSSAVVEDETPPPHDVRVHLVHPGTSARDTVREVLRVLMD